MYNQNVEKPRQSWNVFYYEDAKGRCQVHDFIEKRQERERGKILALLEKLEERGPHLPRPYADFLEQGIHELRVKLRGDQTRFLYFFCYRDFIIITHVFTKNTSRVPSKEIRKAVKLRDDFLGRIRETDLRRRANEDT